MKRTGVFATMEEIDECLKLSDEASKTPVINFGGPESPSWSETAWKHCQETLHRYALAHGLPEIQGFYGLDGVTGEFLES